jgi:hypothetical protein
VLKDHLTASCEADVASSLKDLAEVLSRIDANELADQASRGVSAVRTPAPFIRSPAPPRPPPVAPITPMLSCAPLRHGVPSADTFAEAVDAPDAADNAVAAATAIIQTADAAKRAAEQVAISRREAIAASVAAAAARHDAVAAGTILDPGFVWEMPMTHQQCRME